MGGAAFCFPRRVLLLPKFFPDIIYKLCGFLHCIQPSLFFKKLFARIGKHL